MQRRTKIVCTLGPASWSPERIESLIAAGMDVARINFSHGDLPRHAETIRNVREASTRVGRPIAVLGDLQGPKIRVGVLPQPVVLRPGDRVVFPPRATTTPAPASC
ncbi:MAG: pyruvate kinase, partial [Gemmatimonadetes bacterium]|nr:pyruvate kinase [Gemmatimonadota bacterium]